MDITHDYAIALGEARSRLAALADIAATVDESIHYDRLLLRLDYMHEDYPGCHAVAGTKLELINRLEIAVDQMHNLGGADSLRLELLLDSAILGAADQLCRSNRLESKNTTTTPRRQP